MNKKVNSNRKIIYALIVIFTIIASILLRNQVIQKKENNALKVKLISLAKIKKKSTPWSRLTQKEIASINLEKDKNNISGQVKIPNSIMNNNSSHLNINEENEIKKIDIFDQSLDELVFLLNENMNNIKSIDLNTILRNIEIADEIINRTPESYSAYKAKLISMIYLESKFAQEVDDYEFNNLLYDLANFDLTSDVAIRKEAIFIATSNGQVLLLENKLYNILQMRAEFQNQNTDLEKNNLELQNRDEVLAVDEQATILELEQLESNIKEEASILNEDIVEIAFLRLIAKNDLDTAIDNAYEYLRTFPDSLNGYFYLLRVLELKGEKDEIDEVIKKSNLNVKDQEKLRKRLLESLDEDPKKYWEKLIF